MNSEIEELDLERDFIRWLVGEAVRAGMESSLRGTILDAVEESTEGAPTAGGEPAADEETKSVGSAAEDGRDDSGGKGRIVSAIQGAAVFTVMFVVLYVTLKRLSGDEKGSVIPE